MGINHLSGRTGGREGTDGRSTLFMVGKRNDSKCYIRSKDSDSHKIGKINKNMNSTYAGMQRKIVLYSPSILLLNQPSLKME